MVRGYRSAADYSAHQSCGLYRDCVRLSAVLVLPIHTALTRIDYSLVEASLDLGARPLKTFFSVIVPADQRRDYRRVDAGVHSGGWEL